VDVTKRWESGGLTGRIVLRGGAVRWVQGVLKGDRLGNDAEFRVWLQFNASHPDDAAAHFQDRPGSAVLTGNFHSFKNFFDLSRTGRVAEVHPVAGFPEAESGSFVDVALERGSRVEVKPNAVSKCGCVQYTGNYTFVPYGLQCCEILGGCRTAG